MLELSRVNVTVSQQLSDPTDPWDEPGIWDLAEILG